jgi:hypothetical protein
MAGVIENYSKFKGLSMVKSLQSRNSEPTRDSCRLLNVYRPECFLLKESVCVVQQI